MDVQLVCAKCGSRFQFYAPPREEMKMECIGCGDMIRGIAPEMRNGVYCYATVTGGEELRLDTF